MTHLAMRCRVSQVPARGDVIEIRKRPLMKARPEDVRRLARWLRVQDIDQMSHRQLCKFLHWLFTRRENRARGLAWTW